VRRALRLPAGRDRRLDLLAIALIAIVATGLRAFLAIRHPGPIVYQDEWAYFRVGAWLAGEGANPSAAYYPGYPLVLVPAFLLSGSGFGAFDLAVVTNLLLVPVAVVLATMTVRRIAPQAPRGVLVAAVGAFALYPPLVIYSGLTWSENTLPLLILAAALACGFALRRGGRAWVAPALPAGAAFLTHPRGLACAMALLLIVVGLLVVRSIRWSEAVIAIVATGVALGLAAVIVKSASHAGSHYRPENMSPMRLVHDPRSGLAALSGIVLYAVVSSVGLVVVGLVSAVSGSVRIAKRDRSPGAVISVYLGLCCLGLLAFTTLASSAGLTVRGDYLVYGRYGEPGYAAMLVTGIAWLGTGSIRRVLAMGAAAVVGLVAAFGLVQLAPAGSLRLPVNYVNVLSLVVYMVRVGGLRPYAIVAWSLVAMLVLAGAFAAVRKTAWLVPLLIGLAFVGSTRSAVRHWLTLVTARSTAVRVIPRTVGDLDRAPGGVPCVAFHTADQSGSPGWRIEYFTGVHVQPVATEAEAAAACNGIWMLPPGEAATIGTVVDTEPDGQLVVSNPAYLRQLGR
jgi:hypothetical protein